MGVYDILDTWATRFTTWFNKTFAKNPPFSLGDVVRFKPDERTIGWNASLWNPEPGELYPGYVGKVVEQVQDEEGTWYVRVDAKSSHAWPSFLFKLVKRHRPETTDT